MDCEDGGPALKHGEVSHDLVDERDAQPVRASVPGAGFQSTISQRLSDSMQAESWILKTGKEAR